jgi:hypothetical protein
MGEYHQTILKKCGNIRLHCQHCLKMIQGNGRQAERTSGSPQNYTNKTISTIHNKSIDETPDTQ